MNDYDPNWCLACGLPFTPIQESFETPCIGNLVTHWEADEHGALCQCVDEDDDD